MPSRASEMMNQNTNNVPIGRDESNLLQGKNYNEYTNSASTTQSVDAKQNNPNVDVATKPNVEKSSEINVVRDYDWTYSTNKSRKINEIPYILVKEFKMIGNTYISSLMTTALLYPDIVDSNVGQNPFFQKISTSFSNNSFAKFMGESATANKVMDAVNSTAQKTTNWVKEQMQSLDKTANDWSDEDLIKNYSYLYLRKPTGTSYRFPYFDNDYISIRNNFDDTYSGSAKDKSPLQDVLNIVNEKATAAGQHLNVASVTEPGMYIQRPKFYNFRDEGTIFSIEFHLFNTITENAHEKNLDLITRLLIQNTPHRHNRLLVDPPCIYEITVPGRIFYPYACMEELTVKHVGTKRILKNSKGKDVPVPDAYQISIKFKSLTMEVNNFIVPEMGSSGIDLSKRYGIGESFKGTPPDLTQTATTEAQNKPKTEAEQIAQKQENDSGNQNTITPRTEPNNTTNTKDDATLIREAKERHARNAELRQSDGYANEYQRNKATGKSNEYILGR